MIAVVVSTKIVLVCACACGATNKKNENDTRKKFAKTPHPKQNEIPEQATTNQALIQWP